MQHSPTHGSPCLGLLATRYALPARSDRLDRWRAEGRLRRLNGREDAEDFRVDRNVIGNGTREALNGLRGRPHRARQVTENAVKSMPLVGRWPADAVRRGVVREEREGALVAVAVGPVSGRRHTAHGDQQRQERGGNRTEMTTDPSEHDH